MARRFTWILALWGILIFTGGLHCSGGSSDGLTITITADSDEVIVGEQLQLTATAQDGSGNEVTGLTFTFAVNIPNYATVDSSGLVSTLYPGSVEITASADSVTSAPFVLTINPLANTQTITQLTVNGDQDDWGGNNTWPTIAVNHVIWINSDGVNDNVLVHDLNQPVGTDENLDTEVDLDFLAMGTGAIAGEFMASWREDLTETIVNDNSGGNSNLGAVSQEESSIDQGCLFFREGGGNQDIQLFRLGEGAVELASANDLYNPISSQCQAVWEEDVGATSNLIFYDGTNQTEVAIDLQNFPQFDFSLGQVVYISDDDVFHVDTTTSPFTTTQITNDGPTLLDQRPKTDGNSIVWFQEDPGTNEWQVLLYEIATGTTSVISNNTNEKQPFSLLTINLKQVAWVDAAPNEALFFHPGTGDATDTIEVPQGANSPDVSENPYVDYGVLTWIASDGDNEVFVMQ